MRFIVLRFEIKYSAIIAHGVRNILRFSVRQGEIVIEINLLR
jgi:hypothetical protein